MIELLAQQVVAAVLVMVVVLGPAVTGVWLILRRKRQARQERRSPLSTELLRAPGHTLREQLEDGRVDLAFDTMQLMIVPAAALALLYAGSALTGRLAPPGLVVVLLVAALAFSIHQIRALHKRSEKLDQWRLGLDAELAAGQQLDQLMRQGAVVFHDLTGDRFNVDHVVVAPQGVFAVETKGYRKPNRGGGLDDAKVVYDGRVLRFPDWAGDGPLRQAERQAKWLSEWLTSATGEKTEVMPVLALPGWFIDRQGRGPVMVLSSAEIQQNLLKARDAKPLSDAQLQRVAHQVEQRCRDVKPTYRLDPED